MRAGVIAWMRRRQRQTLDDVLERCHWPPSRCSLERDEWIALSDMLRWVAAARTILDNASKLREEHDVARRIAELENLLSGDQAGE